jgi:uncharacterized membrane protein YphA (DoxX/SURF4 family)
MQTFFQKISDNSFIILFARIIVGMMFIIVGVAKIANAAEFAEEIRNYQIMPEFILNLAAISVAWIELISGIFLLFGVKTKANSLIILAMLFVFTTAVFIAMMKGLNINCGCYSQIASQKVGLPKILENLGLILLTLLILISNNKKFNLS